MTSDPDFEFTVRLPLRPVLGEAARNPIQAVSLFPDEWVCFTVAHPIEVPSFPIHHDVRNPVPGTAYLAAIQRWLEGVRCPLSSLDPELVWGFDPRAPLQPILYRLVERAAGRFLMLLRFDLSYRRGFHNLLERGDTEVTHRYETRRLFFQFDFLPLGQADGDRGRFEVRRLFDPTWVGEVGRGYHLQGIWMDDALTEVFSRMVLPALERHFPFYPLRCRYLTLSAQAVLPNGQAVESLARVMETLARFPDNVFREIQRALRGSSELDPRSVAKEWQERLSAAALGEWPVPPVLEKRLAENGLVEYVVDVFG